MPSFVATAAVTYTFTGASDSASRTIPTAAATVFGITGYNGTGNTLAVTIAGAAATLSYQADDGFGSKNYMAAFVGAPSGSQTVAVSGADVGDNWSCAFRGCDDVDATTPFDGSATDTSSPLSISVTTTADGLAFGILNCDSVPGTTDTSIWGIAGTFYNAATSSAGTGGSVSLDWSGGGSVYISTAFNIRAQGVTYTQAAFRGRNDDGSETTATGIAAQDTDFTQPLATNTRLRTLVNVVGDPGGIIFTQRYKKSTDSAYRKVEVAGGGALAYGTTGSNTTTGTTAPTVAYPASIAEGDLLVMFVVNRPATSTPSTPAGWTAPSNNTLSCGDGTGTGGADSGDVRITVFTKEADGSESGSVTLAITSGTSCGASMSRYTRTTGKLWSVAVVNGATPTTGTTSWSVTGGSDPGVLGGDIVVALSGVNSDAATYSAEALSQTGITFGAANERADFAVTTGNDLRVIVSDHLVTSGTSSAAPVFTMTASTGTPEGGTLFVRVRQTDQPIVMALSANIAAAAATATTSQLTGGSGSFTAGSISDDTVPFPSVDIGSGGNTELELCVTSQSPAANGDIYQFRMHRGLTVLNTYSVTPQWTIGTAGQSVVPVLMAQYRQRLG